VDPAELVAFVCGLAGSPDPVLSTQAQDYLDRLAGVELVKFDVGEARDATGRWTSGSASGRTTTVTQSQTPAQRRAARTQAHQGAATRRRNARDQRAADAKQLGDIRARLAGANTPKPPKGQAAAAVLAARKDYGIPSGKKLGRLPAVRREAAQRIIDGTRAAVKARNAQAKAQVRLKAVEALLARQGLSDKAQAWLQARQQKARTAMDTASQQLRDAQAVLNAGRHAWTHHTRR
jgi:hypothetical protein